MTFSALYRISCCPWSTPHSATITVSNCTRSDRSCSDFIPNAFTDTKETLSRIWRSESMSWIIRDCSWWDRHWRKEGGEEVLSWITKNDRNLMIEYPILSPEPPGESVMQN